MSRPWPPRALTCRTSPIAPSATSCLARVHAALKRRWWAMASLTRLRRAAISMSSHSPRLVAMGFSHSTALGLRAQAAIVIGACSLCQVQIETMSRASSSSIRRKSS